MKELYFGALDLSPYLESITNGYILNLRGVPDSLIVDIILIANRGEYKAIYFSMPGHCFWGKILGIVKGNRHYIAFIGQAGEKVAFYFFE